MTPPKPLSEWADEQGIPRRTAYNWAKSGKLNVPLRRTMTGRLLVLDDDDQTDIDVHPFVAAYAEALNLAVGTHAHDNYYSPVLEFWGSDLYDAVDVDLRPVVLQLALAAACRRVKRDALVRLADWLGRVELADWYEDTGFTEAAEMVRPRHEIVDAKTFYNWWPTGVASHDFWMGLDTAVKKQAEQAGIDDGGDGAAEALAENGLMGLDNLPIAARRDRFRLGVDGFVEDHTKSSTNIGPDRGDLWDLKGLYADPMWALARSLSRSTARTMCEITGWDPDGPSPVDGHPLYEAGYPACKAAAVAALTPYVHRAHLREIEAFRLIAMGKPFVPPHI